MKVTKGSKMRNFFKSKQWLEYLFVLFAAVVAVGPLIYLMIWTSDQNDFRMHIDWARQILRHQEDVPVAVIVHALWQWLVYFTQVVVRQSWNLSALLVTLGSVIATVLIYYSKLRKNISGVLSGLLSIGLLVIGPMGLIILFDVDFGGYIYPNVYHNPTYLLLQPLAILQFFFAVDSLGEKKTGWLGVLVTALVSGAAVYAKPNYIICLMPALALIMLIRLLKKQPMDWTRILVGIVLPSAALLAWQFYLTYANGSDSRIVWMPFEVMKIQGKYLLPKFFLSIGLPLLVTIGYWKQAIRDRRMQLGWLTFAVGSFFTYFLAESGSRFSYGNFFWSSEIALLILFVATVLFLSEKKLLEHKPALRGAILIAGVIHVYFGLAYYFSQIFYFIEIR